MILSEKVELKVKGMKNIKYYNDLGYDTTSEFIIVDIKDLYNGSSSFVNVKCDYCNTIKECRYFIYNKSLLTNNRYACSSICSKKKASESNLLKYGVDNISKLDSIKDKKKETCLKNWGVDCNFKSDITKEKKKETYIKNWGVDNPSKSNIIKDKKKNTTLDNYGVINPFQSEQVKEKIKETNLERYGVENPMSNKEIKEKSNISTIKRYNGIGYSSEFILSKIKETNLERYGYENSQSNFNIKESIKETNLERYGVECSLQNINIKEKTKETNLEKYGFEYAIQNINIKEKIKETNLERYGVEYVSQNNDIKERIKITNTQRYGSDNYNKSELSHSNTKIGNDINYIKYLYNNLSLFNCINGHTFEISSDTYHYRITNNTPLCIICNPIGDSKSIKEKMLLEYIKSIYSGEIISSYRDKMEIDIYLPELKLGFEFNGLYWHSEKFKEKSYHLDKTNYFKDRDIRIIHIWEDDWIFKESIVKSQIHNLLGLNTNKLFARKCVIKNVSTKEARIFLDENHIQGFVNSSFKIGLYYEDELVSIMTFDSFEGRKKMEEGGYNLSRFCNRLGYNVVGGASKLLSYFIKEYNSKRIVSYADKDWSVGSLYYTLGFENIAESKPDYKYIVGDKRVHKSKYRKSKLKTTLTEKQATEKIGISRIYDCGKIKFELLF